MYILCPVAPLSGLSRMEILLSNAKFANLLSMNCGKNTGQRSLINVS